MKDDKICFSKTLTYIVLLVVVIVGAFWVSNYTNTQKLGATPKAIGKCVPYVNASNGIIIKKIGTTCYGNTGYLATSIIGTQNAAGTRVDVNTGCYLKAVPCQMDVVGTTKTKTKPVVSSVTCKENKYVWEQPLSSGSGVTPTGRSVGSGSNKYYAYSQVCTRQTGNYIKIYRYQVDNSEYKTDYRCELSKNNVTEVDCRNSISVAAFKVTPAITKVPVNPTTRPDLSADNKLTIDFPEGCQKDLKAWLSNIRSFKYTSAQELADLTTNKDDANLKWGAWDQCMKATGKAHIVKNSSNGETVFQCEFITVPNGAYPNGGCKH